MKKWLLVLALLVFGYYLNVKIKQWSDRTMGPDSNHLENVDELTNNVRNNIPTKVIKELNPATTENQQLPQNETYPREQSNSVVPDHLPDGKPVEDSNQWKKDISGNTLVSCQTQIQHCEPPQAQNYQDGSVNTFCVAYARNCTNPESIQRTWTNEEVFKPVNPEPENNNPVDNSQDQYQQGQQPDYQQNQYPQDPVAPVDPSTYLPPMPYSEPPPANHEVLHPSEY